MLFYRISGMLFPIRMAIQTELQMTKDLTPLEKAIGELQAAREATLAQIAELTGKTDKLKEELKAVDKALKGLVPL